MTQKNRWLRVYVKGYIVQAMSKIRLANEAFFRRGVELAHRPLCLKFLAESISATTIPGEQMRTDAVVVMLPESVVNYEINHSLFSRRAPVKMKKYFQRLVACSMCVLIVLQPMVVQADGFIETFVFKFLQTPISRILDNELPLKLDATKLYPNVEVLPGAPFNPKPLALTLEALVTPLPPGDYTIPVTAYCSQTSVHRPGQGVGYAIAPVDGKLGEAISTLLWRGTLLGIDRRYLLGISWAIQSGTPYDKMPQNYKKTIEQLLPDFQGKLNGNYLDQIESIYTKATKIPIIGGKLPPINDLLVDHFGEVGKAVVTARAQYKIFTRRDLDDQKKEQVLFAGEESRVYTPVKPEDAPWSSVIPGTYSRLKVVEGYLRSNTLEVRVLTAGAITPADLLGVRMTPQAVAAIGRAGAIAVAATGEIIVAPGVIAATLGVVAGGVIGYAIGRGAQALILAAIVTPSSDDKETTTEAPPADIYCPRNEVFTREDTHDARGCYLRGDNERYRCYSRRHKPCAGVHSHGTLTYQEVRNGQCKPIEKPAVRCEGPFIIETVCAGPTTSCSEGGAETSGIFEY